MYLVFGLVQVIILVGFARAIMQERQRDVPLPPGAIEGLAYLLGAFVVTLVSGVIAVANPQANSFLALLTLLVFLGSMLAMGIGTVLGLSATGMTRTVRVLISLLGAAILMLSPVAWIAWG